MDRRYTYITKIGTERERERGRECVLQRDVSDMCIYIYDPCARPQTVVFRNLWKDAF